MNYTTTNMNMDEQMMAAVLNLQPMRAMARKHAGITLAWHHIRRLMRTLH